MSNIVELINKEGWEIFKEEVRVPSNNPNVSDYVSYIEKVKAYGQIFS